MYDKLYFIRIRNVYPLVGFLPVFWKHQHRSPVTFSKIGTTECITQYGMGISEREMRAKFRRLLQITTRWERDKNPNSLRAVTEICVS